MSTVNKGKGIATETPKVTPKSTLAVDLVKATSKVAVKKEKPIPMFKGFTFGSGDKYPNASHIIMRSYTLAALKVSGFLNIAPKSGLCTGKKGGSYNVFKTLTGNKVTRVWSKTLLDKGYIAKAQGAMKGDAAGGFNGQVELINVIAKAMTSGIKDGLLHLKDSNGVKTTIKLFEVSASKI